MPIAKTKQELLDGMEVEYRKLLDCIAGLGEKEMEQAGVCHEWSTKDVLAHLVEWKMMFLGWYREGLKGGNPKTPAEDLNWRQTPLLNERIYRKWKDARLSDVRRELESTYKKVLKLTTRIPEEELFRKGQYRWLGTMPLSRWIAASTSSHHRWARTRITRWAKQH